MKQSTSLLVTLALLCPFAGCGDSDGDPAQSSESSSKAVEPAPDQEQGHGHGEEPIGTVTLGDLPVELAQGHGAVAAGKVGHLVVKLPYSDGGSTIVRGWIGGEDRTLSYVGKGEYAASQDDYDLHATAPDPLPEGCMWWIEIEKPDGEKLVASAPPLLE